MRRWPQLITIFAMLSLGMGLSQALHHAVAHAPGWDADHTAACAGHCGVARVQSAEHEAPPASPVHDESDCPVCATIASTKSFSLHPATCLPLRAPVVHAVSRDDERVPAPQPARVQRSRAPPAT